MKCVGLLLLLAFSFACQGQSRKFLIISHRLKAKEVVISEGQIVVVKSFKGEKLKGPLEVLSENLIRVKHKVVPLTNIQYIGRTNPEVVRVASLIVSTGMNLFLYGLSDNLKHGWESLSDTHKASVPLLAVGIPLLTVSYKRMSKKWTYKGQVGL